MSNGNVGLDSSRIWNYNLSDDDAAVAGTLLNFDEYDFTFHDDTCKEFHDESTDYSAVTRTRPTKQELDNNGGKMGHSINEAHFHRSPDLSDSFSLLNGEFAVLENTNVDDLEQSCLKTTTWDDKLGANTHEMTIDTKQPLALRNGVTRMITPTQEDFYDDISDASSLMSPDNIVTLDETPWKVGVNESEMHWLTPSARKLPPSHHAELSLSTPKKYRGKSLASLYKARNLKGQYDNVFDDDEHSDGSDSELVQWNKKVQD
jgi:hypothetical protein